MPRPSRFAPILVRVRRAAGLTQLQLAEKVRVTSNYIALLENARRSPSRSFLDRLTSALKLPDPDRLELYTAAGYVPSDLTPERRSRREPKAKSLGERIAEILRDATTSTMSESDRQTVRRANLLGLGFFSIGQNAPTSRKKEIKANQQLADGISRIVHLLTDDAIDLKSRVKLADELLSYTAWKLKCESPQAAGRASARKSRRRANNQQLEQ